MLIAVSLAFVLPVVFMLLTAVMTDQQALTAKLLAGPVRVAQLRHRVPRHQHPAGTRWNTLLYAGLSTVGVVISCVPVAYAFSRLDWRGRNVVFLLVLSTLMLPTQVTSIPLYILWAKQFHDWTGIQFIGTLKPLIIPSFFGDAFSIFLLRQFFMTIPKELTDALRVDGAGDFQILWRVVVAAGQAGDRRGRAVQLHLRLERLLRPARLHRVRTPTRRRCRSPFTSFRGLHHVDWNLTMAAALLFMLPVIAIFFLAQRVFIEGITLTGVKG